MNDSTIVTRKDFLRIVTVLVGAIVGGKVLGVGDEILDIPPIMPDIRDGKWHTVRLINRAGNLSVGIDGEFFESAELVDDIKALVEPLNSIFKADGKTISELISASDNKQTVFIKFDFKAASKHGEAYINDVMYDEGEVIDNQDLSDQSRNDLIHHSGFEMGLLT